MVWIDAAVAVVASLFELGSVLVILSSFADKRKTGHFVNQVLPCMIVMGCMVAINFFQASEFLLLVCYGMIILNTFWYYHFSIPEGVCYCVLGVILASMLKMILYVPVYLICGGSWFWQCIPVMIGVLTFALCLWIRRRGFLLPLRNFSWIKENNGCIVIAVIGGIVFLTILLFKSGAGLSFMEGAYFILAVLAVLFAVYKISIYRYEIKVRKEYAEAYAKMLDLIRSRQHKFMNQIDAIYSLFEVYDNYDDLVREQARELKVLEHYMMPNRILVLERPLIIGHVYQKTCEAMDHGIDLQLNLTCSLQDLQIPDVMLIDIIGNVLDNAMDEVLLRKKDETVYLSIFEKESYICIHVSNEHEKIPHAVYMEFFEDGYSTKGSDRGIGLTYVKKIVKRFKGNLDVCNEMKNGRNCFSVKISFPV